MGEKVIGNAGVTLGGTGSFADHTIAPARLVAKAPTSIDLAAAAALPLVGASAVQGLQTLEAGPATSVLILGGAGAVGSVAVQLAKHAGATVLASASAGDREYVSSLGADEVYDYKDSAAQPSIRRRRHSGCDNRRRWNRVHKLLKPGGRMVSLTTQHSPEAAEAAGVKATTQMTHPTTEILTELVRLVDQGVVRQRITGTFPITKVHEAFASDNQNGGKTVITLQ